MPKLKVPGESIKAKSKPYKPKKSTKKASASKLIDKKVEKVETTNGVSPQTEFYSIFGPSDDEVSFDPLCCVILLEIICFYFTRLQSGRGLKYLSFLR